MKVVDIVVAEITYWVTTEDGRDLTVICGFDGLCGEGTQVYHDGQLIDLSSEEFDEINEKIKKIPIKIGGWE